MAAICLRISADGQEILNRTERSQELDQFAFLAERRTASLSRKLSAAEARSRRLIAQPIIQSEQFGKVAEHIHAFGNFPNFALSKDGKVAAAVRSNYEMPPEVWTGPLGEWRQLTKNNTALTPSLGQS